MDGGEAETGNGSGKMRIRRGASGMAGAIAPLWARRWVRWLTYALGAFLLMIAAFWVLFARDLPDARSLLEYQPPLPTVVRDANGEPVYSYARERRVQLQYSDFPPLLIRAYLAAEDKTFFHHYGVDLPAVAGAVVDYFAKLGSGRRAKGGSTITQQVAKNLLIGDEYSPTRKIKEMFLAYRIESVLTKPQILELYLNQIYLGRNAYGVQAAARAYFDKDLKDLSLPEFAYLAVLPRGPANYQPDDQHMQRAIERRDYVLREMQANGWITQAQYAEATRAPLATVTQRSTMQAVRNGGYYLEEVRRRLIADFGETAKDGPHSVYAGGLWVRSPFNAMMQDQAASALRAGMLRYDAGKGWSGPVGKIEVGDNWAGTLASTFIGVDYSDWRVAVVLSKSGDSAQIGFPDGRTGQLPAAFAALPYRRAGTSAFVAMKPGDLIVVAPSGGAFALRNVPEVSGGMMMEDAHSGRIYAMQGGFDSRLSSYNRVTQAMRQPGSSIKPFVYASALDNGMTPATIIVDGPFCVFQSARLGNKCFRNFSGGGAGPQTMRWGVEQSRNLMTVRAASQTGMDKVVKTIAAMGIGNYQPYLAFALGAGETTVERLVNAYAMLAHQGKQLQPRVIDYVQDRSGKVIWPQRWKPCQGCNMADWDGKPMPRFEIEGRQVMNAMTAYQVIHITEGVIQRGTAQSLRDLDRPIFGKTGTTTGPTNVWFVGGTPDIVAGLYIGFDQPRSLGGYMQGGTFAAPIWKQAMKPILDTMPKSVFVAPDGIRMVRIDRRSGKRVYGQWPTDDPKAAVIWEAFKPETEPRRSIRKDELEERKAIDANLARRATGGRPRNDNDFLQQQGGIY